MYETKTKPVFDWNTEINVNITLKELAVMYAILCWTSTSDADIAVKKAISAHIDLYEGDAPYKIYDDIQKIIKDNGVKVLA
jgi:hypothetical protein